jgi:LysR family transcriptional regulator, hydrogen peroxide-inducible genes activator
MELHRLRYFCAVARTGSFTRAAIEEGVAQPSLSQQIVKLEQTLGAKLFDRLGRSIQLTEYGRTLLPQALAILRQVNEARSTLESLRRGVGATFP